MSYRDPVEFTVGAEDSALRFRHTPLPAFPLVREHEKLLKRVDSESGVLDTLAFTYTDKDLASMQEFSAAGVLRIVKAISSLLDVPTVAVPDVDDEGVPALAPDELPTSLDKLCLYYARLGNVELATHATPGSPPTWVPLREEAAFDALPSPVAIYIVTWRVLRGLFVPFGELLQPFIDKVRTQVSGKPSLSDEETAAPTAPTSVEPSSI